MRSAVIMMLGGYNLHILDAPLVYVQNMEEEGTGYKVNIRKNYLRKGGDKVSFPTRMDRRWFD